LLVAETDVSQTFAVYTSAVGAPIPDDLSKALDPEIWRPMWEEMEEIIMADKEQEDRATGTCSVCRGTDSLAGRKDHHREVGSPARIVEPMTVCERVRTRVFSLGSIFNTRIGER
jgi:hypothetical protein